MTSDPTLTESSSQPPSKGPGTPRTGASAPRRRPAPAWGALLSKYALVLLWLLMIGAFALVLPAGVSMGNAMQAILGSLTPLVFLGMAVVATMSVGEFDLSFASIYGLAGATVPSLVVLHGWSFPAAALAALAVALAFGFLNAALTVLVGINSVVVTLGTASVAGGLAFFISGETTVSGMDPLLSNLALSRVLGLPLIFWFGVLIVVAKNDIAHRSLAAQFAGREVLKTYLALTEGSVQYKTKEIA